MSDLFPNNRGAEQPSVYVLNDGPALPANASRAFIILQNCGTATVGISFANSNPAALSNCSIRLYPATADGAGDGELFLVNLSLQQMAVKFGDTGTRNLMATEYL